MSKLKFPAYEPLDDQLRMLGSDIHPTNELKAAVVTSPATVNIPARVHIKQTAKAVLLYAACIALFLGAIMLLPRLFSQQTPVGTQPSATQPSETTAPTTSDPEDSKYTEQYLRARQIVWDTIKDNTTYHSIDALKIGYIYEFGDILVCITGLHTGECECRPPADRYIPVLGYNLLCPQGLAWEVYYKGKVYSLEDAYYAGILTKENFLTIGKDHFLDLSTNSTKLSSSHIVKDSLASLRFTPDDAETTNIDCLFDGIKTYDQWKANGKGQMSGKLNANACFLFDLDAPAKLTAYIITTGSDADSAQDFPVPIAWYLYGTNDASAASAMRAEGASLESLQDSGQWSLLTYLYDSGIPAKNFLNNIFNIEPENQVDYQYYCWCVEYTGGGRLQVAELELYAEAHEGSTNRDTLANPEQYTELELQDRKSTRLNSSHTS